MLNLSTVCLSFAHKYNIIILYMCCISIVNDVIFNNRVTLTDKSALHDSMRSLQTMLNDFLKEYRWGDRVVYIVHLLENKIIIMTFIQRLFGHRYVCPSIFCVCKLEYTYVLSPLRTRSLIYIYTFLLHVYMMNAWLLCDLCRPKMSEQERRKIVARMDMSPISMEYETELK